MGRSPCCEKEHTNKGAWTKEEDERLINYIKLHGEGCWRSLPKAAGKLFIIILQYSLFFYPKIKNVLCFFYTNPISHNRLAQMWQELQTQMDKLPQTRSKERQLH